MSLDLQSHVAAAVAADRFGEADALQVELEAANADAAALESAHHFTDADLGSSLQSLSSLSAAQDTAAAGQAREGFSPNMLAREKSPAQPVSGPHIPATIDEEPTGNASADNAGGDLGPHTRLQDMAASDAAQSASAQVRLSGVPCMFQLNSKGQALHPLPDLQRRTLAAMHSPCPTDKREHSRRCSDLWRSSGSLREGLARQHKILTGYRFDQGRRPCERWL